MSPIKTIEDLNSSVGELANLMTDTFTSCVRHYEALLPYIGEKGRNFKIYHKLVQVNILLNKLNEELIGLRVQYVTVSSHEQKSEIVLSEGGRKRRPSDMSEVGRHETKCIKLETPFSINSNCSNTLTAETGIDMKLESLVSMDTEETKHSQMQKFDLHTTKNIKTEKKDSNEVEDLLVFPIDDSEIPAAKTSCDTKNNSMIGCFAGDEESSSMADRLLEDSAYYEYADASTRRENNEDCGPLENVKSETSNEDVCEDSGSDLCKYPNIQGRQDFGCTTTSYKAKVPFSSKELSVFTTCNKQSIVPEDRSISSYNKGEGRAALPPPPPPPPPITQEKFHVPVKMSEKLHSAEDNLYGVIRLETGRYKCTLCNRDFLDDSAVQGHVKGKKHKLKQRTAKNKRCAKETKVPNNSSENELLNCPLVHDHLKRKKLKNKSKTAKNSSCAKEFEIPNNSSESAAPVSACSAVSCSLDDTVAIVDDRHEVISIKHAVRLDDMWKYFDETFQVHNKFLAIHFGQVICKLCNKQIGRYVLDVKKHISTVPHLYRVKVLKDIELENKSSNKQLLDIPGILKNIVPRTEFSFRRSKGFFCKICYCFCENEVVLSHMTGANHGINLRELRSKPRTRKPKNTTIKTYKQLLLSLTSARAVQNCHQEPHV